MKSTSDDRTFLFSLLESWVRLLVTDDFDESQPKYMEVASKADESVTGNPIPMEILAESLDEV
jgi:hypothetical protein